MTASELTVGGVSLQADLSGALYWPAQELLAVADLHLEKGSSFTPGGSLLPPYDTRATLERLDAVLCRYRPQRVLCLGDSFYDAQAVARLHDSDRTYLVAMASDCEWVWIAGNHDPEPPDTLPGRVESEVTIGPLVFRHKAAAPTPPGEVSGHFHPIAKVHVRGRSLRGRCFASDGRRLVLPAFGAYTGGLNVLDPAVRALFRAGFRVHLLGRNRVHVIHENRLASSGF